MKTASQIAWLENLHDTGRPTDNHAVLSQNIFLHFQIQHIHLFRISCILFHLLWILSNSRALYKPASGSPHLLPVLFIMICNRSIYSDFC